MVPLAGAGLNLGRRSQGWDHCSIAGQRCPGHQQALLSPCSQQYLCVCGQNEAILCCPLVGGGGTCWAPLSAAQTPAVPPLTGVVGRGFTRLLMWSINRGGDRVGQRREAGAAMHCSR